MSRIRARVGEPSTWSGIGIIAALVSQHFGPEWAEVANYGAMTLIALFEVARKEHFWRG